MHIAYKLNFHLKEVQPRFIHYLNGKPLDFIRVDELHHRIIVKKIIIFQRNILILHYTFFGGEKKVVIEIVDCSFCMSWEITGYLHYF